MKTKCYLINPGSMEATVEITMTIADFKEYLNATKDATRWPAWKVRDAIQSIVNKASQSFNETIDSSKDS